MGFIVECMSTITTASVFAEQLGLAVPCDHVTATLVCPNCHGHNPLEREYAANHTGEHIACVRCGVVSVIPSLVEE